MEYIRFAPDGYMVSISEPKQSNIQREKYHAMIGDIAKQYKHCEQVFDADSMKRLCIDQFKRDTLHDADIGPLWLAQGQLRMAPSLDRSGVVMLGEQSRNFGKKLSNAFIEWLYAFGAEHRVIWSDEAAPPESYGGTG